jgi:hypothetical protein
LLTDWSEQHLSFLGIVAVVAIQEKDDVRTIQRRQPSEACLAIAAARLMDDSSTHFSRPGARAINGSVVDDDDIIDDAFHLSPGFGQVAQNTDYGILFVECWDDDGNGQHQVYRGGESAGTIYQLR